jgi:hypothetical protein
MGAKLNIFLLYRVRLRSKYANNVFVTKNKKGHDDFKIRRKVFTKNSNQQRVTTTKLLKSVYPMGATVNRVICWGTIETMHSPVHTKINYRDVPKLTNLPQKSEFQLWHNYPSLWLEACSVLAAYTLEKVVWKMAAWRATSLLLILAPWTAVRTLCKVSCSSHIENPL